MTLEDGASGMQLVADQDFSRPIQAPVDAELKTEIHRVMAELEGPRRHLLQASVSPPIPFLLQEESLAWYILPECAEMACNSNLMGYKHLATAVQSAQACLTCSNCQLQLLLFGQVIKQAFENAVNCWLLACMSGWLLLLRALFFVICCHLTHVHQCMLQMLSRMSLVSHYRDGRKSLSKRLM